MKMKVQLVVCAEDGREEEVHEIAVVEKPYERIEHLGLTLAQAKALLKTLQQQLVEWQATAFVEAQAQCDSCGKALGIKGSHTRTFRTLFGTIALTSPRLYALPLPAAQDHQLPVAERSADQRGRPRAALHGDEVGLPGLVWPNGATLAKVSVTSMATVMQVKIPAFGTS
jgi:hypothetical protein